jgi:hypothetical protein
MKNNKNSNKYLRFFYNLFFLIIFFSQAGVLPLLSEQTPLYDYKEATFLKKITYNEWDIKAQSDDKGKKWTIENALTLSSSLVAPSCNIQMSYKAKLYMRLTVENDEPYEFGLTDFNISCNFNLSYVCIGFSCPQNPGDITLNIKANNTMNATPENIITKDILLCTTINNDVCGDFDINDLSFTISPNIDPKILQALKLVFYYKIERLVLPVSSTKPGSAIISVNYTCLPHT